MIGPPHPPAAVARRCDAYAGGVELPSSLGRLAAELPVPVRRLGYRWAYTGLRVYWFFRRPDTSGVKCVLTDGDRILLVRHSYGPRGWDLPGGSIRPGEAPVDAARREMNEELGIAIHDFGRLGEIVVHDEHREDHVHCFSAELRAPRLTIDHGELVTADWFPRRELPSGLGRYVQTIIATLPPVG
jgi:8-oxo-dGTP pyrophosphatase MutT (NUDIX family)